MSARILVFTCACVLTLATSAFADEEKLEVAILDVADVVAPRATVRGPRLGVDPHWAYEAEGETVAPAPFLIVEELAKFLRETVQPSSWEEVDGAEINAWGTTLLVRNRADVVRKIERKVAEVRAQALRRVLVSVRVREGPSRAYPAVGEGGALVASGSVEAPLGIGRSLAVTNTIRYVSDYEVEIAQGSNIANPVVAEGLEGLVADVVAHPTLQGDRVLLEAVVQRGAFGEPRRHQLALDEEYFAQPFRSVRRSHNGVVELPIYEGVAARVTCLATSGQVVQVPLVDGAKQLTLELEARLLGAPMSSELVRIGALTRRPRELYVGLPQEVSGEARDRLIAPKLRVGNQGTRPLWMGEDEVMEAVQTLVRPDFWEEGSGYLSVLSSRLLSVRARPDVRDEVLAFLRRREAAAIRPLLVDLRIVSVDAGAEIEIGPGRSAPADGARLLHAARLPTIAGRVASVQLGSTADFLADYDVEVAQEARIADPTTGQSFDGLALNVRPLLAPAGDAVALDIEMQVANRTIESKPFDPEAQYLGPIDKVEVARAGANTQLLVPLRGSYVLDLGLDPTTEGRRVVAEIRILPQ